MYACRRLNLPRSHLARLNLACITPGSARCYADRPSPLSPHLLNRRGAQSAAICAPSAPLPTDLTRHAARCSGDAAALPLSCCSDAAVSPSRRPSDDAASPTRRRQRRHALTLRCCTPVAARPSEAAARDATDSRFGASAPMPRSQPACPATLPTTHQEGRGAIAGLACPRGTPLAVP